MKRVLAAILLAACLVLPTAASAKPPSKTYVPPGVSAASQYVEVVPTAGGGRPSSSIHVTAPGSGATQRGSGEGLIKHATVRKLDAMGTPGTGAAAAALATAPSAGARGVAHSPSRGRPRKTGGVAVAIQTKPAGSTGAALFDAVTGSTGGGGLGALLSMILIGCVLLAGAMALLRHRRAAS